MCNVRISSADVVQVWDFNIHVILHFTAEPNFRDVMLLMFKICVGFHTRPKVKIRYFYRRKFIHLYICSKSCVLLKFNTVECWWSFVISAAQIIFCWNLKIKESCQCKHVSGFSSCSAYVQLRDFFFILSTSILKSWFLALVHASWN